MVWFGSKCNASSQAMESQHNQWLNFKHSIINMLLKIVFGNQIRLFDCKQTLTLANLHTFVKKTFPHLGSYQLYYLDEENDEIVLESQDDVTVYFQGFDKKPKIHVRKVEPESVPCERTQSIICVQFEESVEEKLEQGTQLPKKQPQQQLELSYSRMAQLVDQQQKQEKSRLRRLKSNDSQDKAQEYQKLALSRIVRQFDQQQQKKEARLENLERNDTYPNKECSKCKGDLSVNVAYQCFRCQNLIFCQPCYKETTHKELHPFVEVRNANTVVTEAKVELEQPAIEKKQVQKQQKPKQQKDEQLIYESEYERRQLIISYLQSLFGQDNCQTYYSFAKTSTDKTYLSVYESFVAWNSGIKERKGLRQLWRWIGQKVSNEFDKIVNFSHY